MMLETLNGVMKKVSFVVRFLAVLSILTGLLVLISSVILSRFQRIKESVLLRTMGASKKQIFRINALEYFFLGGLASASGIVLGLLASLGLGHFYFGRHLLPLLITNAGHIQFHNRADHSDRTRQQPKCYQQTSAGSAQKRGSLKPGGSIILSHRQSSSFLIYLDRPNRIDL